MMKFLKEEVITKFTAYLILPYINGVSIDYDSSKAINHVKLLIGHAHQRETTLNTTQLKQTGQALLDLAKEIDSIQ